MGIRNFDPQIGMKVSIYLTRNKKNSEFFSLVGLRAMAVRVIGRFGAKMETVHLRHEGSMIGVQCPLVICRGPFYLPKGTFLRIFAIYGFCRKSRYCEFFFMGRCLSRGWVRRSKMI